MNRLAAILLFAIATTAQAAQVSFSFTNSAGNPDTNWFRVIPVSGPVANADGSFTTIGLPIRITPAADGRATNSLGENNYIATNAFLGKGIVFRVPNDTGGTVYPMYDLRISGYNTFVTLSYGTNPPPTSSEVTNALGYQPLSPTQSTNVANTAALNATNGFTSLTTTNPALVVYTHQLVDLTNGFALNTITNGLAGTNYVNTASNTVRSIAFTIGANTTNHVTSYVSTATNSLETRSVTLLNTASNALVSLIGTGGSGDTVAEGARISLVTNGAVVTVTALQQTNNFGNIVFSNATAFPSLSVTTNIARTVTNGFSSIVTSNATLFVGTNDARAVSLTNAAGLFGGKLTNGVNLGNAFSSPGSGAESEQFGNQAIASGDQSFAAGFQALASGLESTAIGLVSEAVDEKTTAVGATASANAHRATMIGFQAVGGNSASNTVVIGAVARAQEQNTVLIGPGTYSIYSNTVAIGPYVTNTVAGQILLGTASQTIYIPGNATISGTLTNGQTVLTNLYVDRDVIFAWTTNNVWVSGAGTPRANGTYIYGSAAVYTNVADATFTLNFQNPTWFISSNSTAFYSASSPAEAWSIVSGASAAPTSGFGANMDMSGENWLGYIYSTNLEQRISSKQPASGNLTNFAGLSTNQFVYTNSLSLLQPGNIYLTNISLTGANTNRYIGSDTITLTTNSGGVVTIQNISQYVNSTVTNQWREDATNAVNLASNVLSLAKLSADVGGVTDGGLLTNVNAEELGGFAPTAFALTTNIYVSSTGSDSAAGSFAAPLLTPTNAFQRLANNGTVILRGGDYFNYDNNFTNAEGITIMAYPGEQPKFWWGQGIAPGSFSALSNGIFTMTVTAGISNTIHYLTNLWDGWNPAGRGIMLIQTNVSFEVNQQSYLLPSMFTGREDTNHVDHTPLLRASSVTSMTHSNRLWRLEGSTLYIKFAVSNVAGGLWLPATNRTSTFIHSATPRTRVKIVGVTSMFGWHGFDFAGAGAASAESCRAIGSGANGFTVGLTSDAPLTGNVSVKNCEGALVNGFGFNFTGSRDGRRWSYVTEDACKWVLCLREGSTVREGVFRTINNSIVYGGWITQYGFVDQGSFTYAYNCTTISNTVAGFQLGAAGASLGRMSFQSLTGCKMIQDNVSVQLDDENNVLHVYNNFFDPFTSLGGINISDSPETHTVRRAGNVMASGAFNLINGTDVDLYPTRYPAGLFAIGADSRFQAGSLIMGGSDITSGFAFYLNNNVKFTTTGIGYFAAGAITNGNSVWFDRTNTPPPASLNRVWLATDTNAPTTIFVGNNGTWVEK